MLLEVAYMFYCALFALANAMAIGRGRRIFHGLNGLTHLLVAGATAYFEGPLRGLCMLLIARLFFDSLLSMFRGLPLDYVSDDPKSLVDRLEKRVFGEDGLTPKLIYLWTIILIKILPYVSL